MGNQLAQAHIAKAHKLAKEAMVSLEDMDQVVRSVGSVGHATFGHTAIARW